MRTIKSQMTLCGNFTLTLYSGYILRRDFHLHPISCQRSSLCYAILLHLTFQKHRNHSNCCNFSLMTGKLSQRKWKPILPIFDSVMNSENSKIKSWFRREDLFEFDFAYIWRPRGTKKPLDWTNTYAPLIFITWRH